MIRGVNAVSKYLYDRQGGYAPLKMMPMSWDTSMPSMKAKGFTGIRLPFFLEAKEKSENMFSTDLVSALTAAEKYDMQVILCNMQYKTSYAVELAETGVGDGGGFPVSLTNGYKSKAKFWSDLYDNVNDMQDSVLGEWLDIVSLADSYSCVVAYELQNEPRIDSADQYAKLGAYHTKLATSIRSKSSKTIIFDKAQPSTTSMLAYINPTYDKLTVPRNVSNIMFSCHPYEVPGTTTFIHNWAGYANLAKSMGVRLIFTEWGATTQANIETYVQRINSLGVSNFRYIWDAVDPKYELYDDVNGVYVANSQMQWVQDAFAKYPMLSASHWG